MQQIEINRKGIISSPDNENGWFVLIEEDDGAYYILLSPDITFKSGKGFDAWVENYDSLVGFIEESNWKIEWLSKENYL